MKAGRDLRQSDTRLPESQGFSYTGVEVNACVQMRRALDTPQSTPLRKCAYHWNREESVSLAYHDCTFKMDGQLPHWRFAVGMAFGTLRTTLTPYTTMFRHPIVNE